MPIAKEARLILIVMGVIFAFIHYYYDFNIAWPFWAFFAFLLFFFRDFRRSIPAIPLAVVSPIDGKVVKIDEIKDLYLDRTVQRIHIRQSYFGEFNVHSPVEGKVQNLWVNSPTEPVYPQLAIWIQTDESDDIILSSNLASPLRHASCDISAGEKLGQGQRCGFMAFACEIMVYLPLTAHIAIKTGQPVRAGSDMLAEFDHHATT